MNVGPSVVNERAREKEDSSPEIASMTRDLVSRVSI
jgi:hypothetical protein